jgi:hypothetical protein
MHLRLDHAEPGATERAVPTNRPWNVISPLARARLGARERLRYF